ncbi:MAG: PTS sugar transporter subunit IIC, partial [Carnobacterium sp.]
LTAGIILGGTLQMIALGWANIGAAVESFGTLRTSNLTPFAFRFSKASTSACPIESTLLTTTFPTE